MASGTLLRRTQWAGWWRLAGPVGAAAAAVASMGLTRHQAGVVLLLVLLLGSFAVALLLVSRGPLSGVRLLGGAVWGYAGLGFIVWSRPLGCLVIALVLATTPPVRTVLTRTRAASTAPCGRWDLWSDRDLLSQWSRSGRALRLSQGRREHTLRIVARRAALLDEIDRRGLLHRCRP